MIPLLGLSMLMGMAPTDPSVRPPPAPPLDWDLSLAWRWGGRPDWAAFQARWGGEWAVRWDPRNGTPRFLYSPGVPLARAPELAAQVAALAGVPAGELVLTQVRRRQQGNETREIWRFERRWQGALVVGDQVALVAINGRIGGVWVQLGPLGRLPSPKADEVVLRLGERLIPALAIADRDGFDVVYRDRRGTELLRYDTRSFATATQLHETRTVDDPLTSGAARGITVTDADGATDVTADDGSHGLKGDLSLMLTGPSLQILDNGSEVTLSGTDDVEIEAGVDAPYAAVDVLHHFHVAWDWLGGLWPGHSWLGDQVIATVRLPATCNAYYTSGTINFYAAGGPCNDTGRIADVIYHELGHGIHEYILAAGTFAGDVSEGSGDYISATLLDDPELAPGFYVSGESIREIETDKRYPDDFIDEVHNDGLIWASFLWNLRAQWSDAYGETDGVAMTDLLFLGALEQGPTLTDLYEAVILADDDNGDLSDGTPHACELAELLAQHGIGPGPIGLVQFDHTPLEPQASSTPGYEVSFDLYALTASCADLDEDSVELWFSIDSQALPDTATSGDTGDTGDTGGATDVEVLPVEGWTQVPLVRSGDTWTGTIPRQPADTQVRYFMRASSGDGTQTVNTHGDNEDGLYAFWVGDRFALWCEDFESGATDWEHGAGLPWAAGSSPDWVDQWEVGAPASASSWKPDSAWSGTNIAATSLSDEYAPNNACYLRSPPVDLSGEGRMRLLSARRWLSVEDALYDRAELRVDDNEQLWVNGRSDAGNEHVLDVGWTLHEVELDDRGQEPTDTGDAGLSFTWGLISDSGLEFGGWALDDVCVVELDDVPGHYRVADLVASDDQAQVEVRWTQPWIRPLTATVLVRKAGGWPDAIDDGVIVDLDLAPQWGQERVAVDPDAAPGDVFHYALFAADATDSWYVDIVEGENADQGSVPAPEDTGVVDTGGGDGGGEADSGTDPGNEAPDLPGLQVAIASGCGCAHGSAPSGWLAGLLPLLVWGRRRRR
jgi:uncharacterized protein (TIGR03382 family)